MSSGTLDLTLLLCVRALDFIVRDTLLPSVKAAEARHDAEEVKKATARRHYLTARIDALVFWASSARYVRLEKFAHLN